jgi:hypothetical protein
LQRTKKTCHGLFLFSTFLKIETLLGQALQHIREILCGFFKMFCRLSNRMLKKSASGVLASLRGSTLRGTPRICEILKGLIRSPRLIAGANGYTKCGPYLLASSLAAALLDSLFEHPAAI